jgi:hypothetical protein
MSAAQQKIDWVRRAIREMRDAESRASREDFQYHFGAFLAPIGSSCSTVRREISGSTIWMNKISIIVPALIFETSMSTSTMWRVSRARSSK